MLPLRLFRCILIVLALPLSAQQLATFGESFPLSNTRYIPLRETVSDFFAPEAPVLRTHGTDAFVFHCDVNGVRVARVDASPRIARLVFPFAVTSSWLFDVVWTGSHFLAVAVDRNASYQMWGRLIDARGEPAGDPFLVGSGLFPALAFNGHYVLMVHSDGGVNRSTVLLPDGTPSGFAPQDLPNSLSVDRAVVTSNGSRFATVIPAGGNAAAVFVLFDENGQILTQQTIADEINWAIASDGNRFLALHAHGHASSLFLFDRDGALLATHDLVDANDSLFYRNALVLWSGSRWLVSRVASNEGQVLELDADAKEVLSTTWVHNTQVALSVLGGTVLGAWWANREIVVGAFPFDHGVTPVVHEAASQRLLAMATSSHSTLFLWNESGGIRAGVRTGDGRWREHVLGTVAANIVAASDGNAFVVIANGEVIRLDANGERIAGILQLAPFLPASIVWNGTHYGIIGVRGDGRIVTATLTGSGFSAPAVLPPSSDPIGAPVLVSSGGGFLAAWTVLDCQVECFADRIDAVPLSSSLEPAGPITSVTAADESIYGPFGVAWNGSRHVLAYRTPAGVRAREIDRTGSLGERRDISAESAVFLQVVSAGDGVIIAWAGSSRMDYRSVSLSQSGVLSEPQSIHQEQHLNDWGGALTKLPDGRLAFAFYAPQRAAPHHASPHLMLSIAGATTVPDAPRASLGANVLSWTPPSTPGVTGYRVEQRTGDDEWIEIDRWFDPDELSLVLPAKPESTVSFRVRAFSDGGAGAYSAPAQPGKRRRAVRSG